MGDARTGPRLETDRGPDVLKNVGEGALLRIDQQQPGTRQAEIGFPGAEHGAIR